MGPLYLFCSCANILESSLENIIDARNHDYFLFVSGIFDDY
jgi:CO dehydrogenase/acetyl-CoA synthase beta subunit